MGHFPPLVFSKRCFSDPSHWLAMQALPVRGRRTCLKHIYSSAIYIYICCRVKICPKIAIIWVKNLSNFSFFLCCFSKLFFFLEGERDKKQKKIRQKLPFFESNICPIMFPNMLGQIFDSTLARFLTRLFHIFGPFSTYVETPYFIGFSAKNMFVAHPPK